MRVLIASKFLHHVGGVETYVRWLANTLPEHDVEIALLGMSPPPGDRLMDMPSAPTWLTANRSFESGSRHRVRSALLSVWSPEAGARMREAIGDFEPDLVHFHGTCYQLTPAVVQAVASAGVPMVLTAHEFKLACANQTLFDDSRQAICTACVGASTVEKVVAPLKRSCMKGSRAVTALGAAESVVAKRVWHGADPRILAPSKFMQSILRDDGWPHDRVDYLDLPWRSEDETPLIDPAGSTTRRNAVFLGRLAPVKGADRLLQAWARVADIHPHARLRILGDGSERTALEDVVATSGIPRVDFLGHCGAAEIAEELRAALVTVHPARWYENSPFAVRESLMAGVPAIVSDLGGMPEMVGPNSGWVVPPDDDEALATSLASALSSGLAGSARMHMEVAQRALTDVRHMRGLMQVYRDEIKRANRPCIDSGVRRPTDEGPPA